MYKILFIEIYEKEDCQNFRNFRYSDPQILLHGSLCWMMILRLSDSMVLCFSIDCLVGWSKGGPIQVRFSLPSWASASFHMKYIKCLLRCSTFLYIIGSRFRHLCLIENKVFLLVFMVYREMFFLVICKPSCFLDYHIKCYLLILLVYIIYFSCYKLYEKYIIWVAI